MFYHPKLTNMPSSWPEGSLDCQSPQGSSQYINFEGEVTPGCLRDLVCMCTDPGLHVHVMSTLLTNSCPCPSPPLAFWTALWKKDPEKKMALLQAVWGWWSGKFWGPCLSLGWGDGSSSSCSLDPAYFSLHGEGLSQGWPGQGTQNIGPGWSLLEWV